MIGPEVQADRAGQQQVGASHSTGPYTQQLTDSLCVFLHLAVGALRGLPCVCHRGTSEAGGGTTVLMLVVHPSHTCGGVEWVVAGR